jgi:hypothetical protein
MLVRRKRARGLGALTLVAALLLGGAQPALAADCGGFNCYAIGYSTSGGTNWGGGQARWDTRSYFAPDWASGGFASQVLWVYTRSGLSNWVEIGYTHGWAGQNLRTLYWAECCPYNEHRITTSPGSVGSLHTYTGQQVNNNAYTVYFDFARVADSNNNPPWTREIDAGLEATDQGATFPTTTDDRLQYRDSGCCTGHWHSWPNGHTYEDRPPYDWTWITNWTSGRTSRCGC